MGSVFSTGHNVIERQEVPVSSEGQEVPVSLHLPIQEARGQQTPITILWF